MCLWVAEDSLRRNVPRYVHDRICVVIQHGGAIALVWKNTSPLTRNFAVATTATTSLGSEGSRAWFRQCLESSAKQTRNWNDRLHKCGVPVPYNSPGLPNACRRARKHTYNKGTTPRRNVRVCVLRAGNHGRDPRGVSSRSSHGSRRY